MPLGWHPTILWGCCLPEETEPMFGNEISIELVENKICWEVVQSWQSCDKVEGKVDKIWQEW